MKKYTLLCWILVAEIGILCWFYVYGSSGIFVVAQLKNKSAEIEKEIFVAKQGIEELKATIHTWQSDPFYKEKIAREKLHMAREKDIVYLV